MTRAELLKIWRSLSKPMKRAMDEAADTGLRRTEQGWFGKGIHPHAVGTLNALADRRILAIHDRSARLTPHGVAVFRSVGEPLS